MWKKTLYLALVFVLPLNYSEKASFVALSVLSLYCFVMLFFCLCQCCNSLELLPQSRFKPSLTMGLTAVM